MEDGNRLSQRIACLYFRGGAGGGRGTVDAASTTGQGLPLTELAEACFRFTPQVALREGEAIFLEIGASANLFSEDSLPLRLATLSQRFGLLPSIGFADDAATALAMAKHGYKEKGRLPLEALAEYANPFRRDELVAKRVARIVDALRMLGLSCLKDFLQLPAQTLASRFGSEGLELHLQVRGEIPLIWPSFKLPEKIIEKEELFDPEGSSPCMGLEPLLFVLKGLVDRAVARLRGRGLRASVLQIDLGLEWESERERSWRIELPMPQGSASGLMPILRDRLDFDFNRKPLTGSIQSVTLTVVETTPGHGAQKNLFSRNELEAEAWDALVGRLRQRLGKDRAFAALPQEKYLPEEAWQPVSEPPQNESPADTAGELPPRPARVLKKPRLLRKEGEKLVCVEPGRQWVVRKWIGPERISCEWWQDTSFKGFNRDYYHVITANGEQLWVYRVPGQNELYLHGYFD